MNRRRADGVAVLVVAVIVLGGGALGWGALQQRPAGRSMAMVDTSMGTMHGSTPLWYAAGAFVLAALVVAGYLLVRDDIPEATDEASKAAPDVVAPGPATDRAATAAGDRPGASGERRVFERLSGDERRILDRVVDSPGLTQVALGDRSVFSQHTVSQTVSALEERGLLHRERQGRTCRVYPDESIAPEHASGAEHHESSTPEESIPHP